MRNLRRSRSQIPTLFSNRLLLRPFTKKDIGLVTLALSQPETCYWLQHIPFPYTSSDSAAWIAKHQQAWRCGTSLELAIEEKRTLQLVGAMGLFELTSTTGYLGYWLAPQYWGKGYCLEAALTLARWSSAHLCLRTLKGRCVRENSRSARTLQRIGMTLEYIDYNSRFINGNLHDVMHYSMPLR